MKNIVFLDIENTIIDDLVNRQFLDDNCERIKKFLKSADFVCFNTWGWITKNEIDPILIRLMLDRLEVDKEKRFFQVLVKEDSVDEAIRDGWLIEQDKERAMCPGMMEEFGLTKPSCFISLAAAIEVNEPTTFWLVDDLVDKFEKLDFGKIKVCLVNPKDIKENGKIV